MNTKAMEDAIKRLMKYCERANKEVTQSIERRQLVMDIEMIYSGLMEQRDAALKLADEILIHQVSPLLRDSEWVMGRMDGKRHVAKELRAIFEEKP